MITSRSFASAAGLVLALSAPFSVADSTKAHCDFYSHGDKKSDRSGPCNFSQRQGYVDITLANGRSFDLKPGEKANHFHDQEGHEVKRESSGGDNQVYHWEHKKIVVSFGGGHGHSKAASDAIAVKDMPRYCAGEASAKFNRRPADISTQKAFKDQGMYTVYGQYPPSGADPTVFICTFSAERQACWCRQTVTTSKQRRSRKLATNLAAAAFVTQLTACGAIGDMSSINKASEYAVNCQPDKAITVLEQTHQEGGLSATWLCWKRSWCCETQAAPVRLMPPWMSIWRCRRSTPRTGPKPRSRFRIALMNCGRKLRQDQTGKSTCPNR